MARDSSSFQPRFAARETEPSRRRRCDGALLDACRELSEPLTALANYLAVERRLIDRGEEIGAAGIAEILGKMSAQVSRAGRTLARLRQLLRDGPDEPSSDAGEQAARPHLIDPHELRKLAAWYREFAERAGDPWIWQVRLRRADELEKEAARQEKQLNQAGQTVSPPEA